MDIDLKNLIKSGLSPTLYVTLQAIYYKDETLKQYLINIQIFTRAVEQLEKEGFLKITGGDLTRDFILRNKALSLYGEKNNVSEWYEEWRNLFPDGINPAGYRYRGNKQQVLKNLTRFVNKHPSYTKDQIFQATRNYITRCRKLNSYMLLAHYFIEKQNVGSTLQTELENLDENTQSIRRVTIL